MEVNENNINNNIVSTSKSQELLFRDLENDFGYVDTTNQLIANLGHELQNVRMRALKCLWRKIDCGLLSTDSLSKRVDLLNRLTPWIRVDDAADRDYEGFQLVIRLCTRLAQFDEFRKLFIGNHLDTLLSKRRLEFGGEIRKSIKTLLDRVGSFYIHCEGPADEEWEGNLSVPPHPPAITNPTPRNIALTSFREMDELDKFSELSGYSDVPVQHFFPKSKSREPPPTHSTYVQPWRKVKVHQSVTIKTVRLGPSDRRVLSSTVDSLNSKNENLVFMTCSFVRDVLLYDFPPEVFIQESAVSLSLAQVVQDSWMDERVNYVAFQALLKISRILRARFQQLNSSDFHSSEGGFVSDTKGPQGYYGESYPLSAADLSFSNSDYFAANICKILRVLSRSILFDSNRVTRWILLSSFTVTFLKCVQIFPNISTKNLMMLLQEILYDLKSSGDTYSNSYSSRPLAPFQPADDDEVIFGDYLLESISYAYQGKLKNGSWEDPQKPIISFLIDVQNSSGHRGVFDAIHHLKEFSFVLLLKSRHYTSVSARRGKGKMSHQSSRDQDSQTIFRSPHWREAFYRFLSVEPTSQEDEDLLVRVLDLLGFILTNVESSHPLLEWIVPLCGSKGCATLRLVTQHCNKIEADSSGTTLPTILRSLFDFYHCLLAKEPKTADELQLTWELFSTFSQILSDAAADNYTSSASLHGVLYGITNLTSYPSIQEKLLKNRNFILGLLRRVCEALASLGERSSVDSFRNRGPIHYASLSMLHLIIILDKSNNSNEKEANWEWIDKCIENTSFLWTLECTHARAVAFQICQILCASQKGVSALLSGLDPPALAWGMPYRHLTNAAEAPIVQYRAAAVLVNMFNNWRELGKVSRYVEKKFPLEIDEFLEDMVKLVSGVYWHSKLNRCGAKAARRQQKEQSDSSDDSMSAFSYPLSARSGGEAETDDIPAFITPSVLSYLCKLFLTIVKDFLTENATRDAASLTKSSFVQSIMSSGISSILFRLLSNHEELTAQDMDESSWLRCCSALSSIVQALISISQLDRNSSIILIGDKRSLSHMIQLFLLRPPQNCSERTKDTLSFLWINVFTLQSILCVDAGENFEDFQRTVWAHWSIIFPRIYNWLHNDARVKFRQTVLTFIRSFLSMTTKLQQQEKEVTGHPILCDGYWSEGQCSYGTALCNCLKAIISESLDLEERVAVLHAFAAIFNLSPKSRNYAIDIELVPILVEKLRSFGVKYFEPTTQANSKKKNIELWHEETFWTLAVLTALLYDNERGREQALKHNLADTLHKIFKWWTMSPDRALLHTFIECLLNFTEEFPQGSHSLTVTTNLVGVTPRKVATPQSIFIELLNILQNELDAVDKNPSIKTIDLCFSLLRNCTYVVECRTITAKTQIFAFIRRLHANETKKWGPKQNHVKEQYLQFLVHLTINADVQNLFPKVPEAVEILLALTAEQPPMCLLALKVLRNLCFHSGNRPRFLCDATFIPTLVSKLRNSKDAEELESAGVTLWALTANSEKGKLLAKKSSCGASVLSAIQRLRKMEKSSNDVCVEKHDYSHLITTLSKVAVILGEDERNF